jgi:hypothetical protein
MIRPIEARAFVEGSAGTTLAAAFVAEDEESKPLGFIEAAVRAFSDGCDSMPAHEACGFEEVDRLIKFRKALD